MTDPATADLVERARAGDTAAYEQLFARIAGRLHLYVRARMGPALRARLDSVDVVQETYAAALRDFAGFQPRDEGAFCRWIYRIAAHRLADLAAHHGAQKRRAPAERVPESIAELRSPGGGPSTQAGRHEEQERLLAAIDALEEEERRVVLLRHFEGLTLQEVAAETGTTLARVRGLLDRAQYQLGCALGGV